LQLSEQTAIVTVREHGLTIATDTGVVRSGREADAMRSVPRRELMTRIKRSPRVY
jgi:hypothetical protein